MHGHQAIVFLQLHISAVDREVHHSKHKTTPSLFEAGGPGGRVRAHTTPTQISQISIVLGAMLHETASWGLAALAAFTATFTVSLLVWGPAY